jgi:hypothetical protein
VPFLHDHFTRTAPDDSRAPSKLPANQDALRFAPRGTCTLGNFDSNEETTMTIRFGKRFWLLGVCAAMAAIPVASHAKQDAMDTCIQAFVAEQLPQGRKIEIVKRRTSQLQWGSTSTRPATINVNAKGKRTGQEYGAATCEMNRKGELVAMVVKGERIRYADASQPKAHGG